MTIDIMNEETWERLIHGADRIPADWNQKCEASIREQKKEIEGRYGIRIGRTEIYCSRCGKSCVPGVHTCQDIRFKQLNEAKSIHTPIMGRIRSLKRSCAL